MGFVFKDAKVKEDGTLEDVNGNKIQVGAKGYALSKARINAGGTFVRKVRTIADYKLEMDKRAKGSFKWFKAVAGSKGFSINKDGFKAVMESIVDGTLNMNKIEATLTKYKKKVITSTIVDVSNGKETEFTKGILEKEAVKLANETKREEARANKLAERKEKLQKAIEEKQARYQKMVALEEAKIEEMKKSL